MKLLPALIAFAAAAVSAVGQNEIDPTFLRSNLERAHEAHADIATRTCHYKPLFGAGAPHASAAVGIARYGEAIVEPGGSCAVVNYPNEEQVYVVLAGSGSVRYGALSVPVKKDDYLYLPPGVPHTLTTQSREQLRVVVMGFRTKAVGPHAGRPAVANIDDVPLQAVKGHPLSAQYRLLMGDIYSKRDRIAAAHLLTSLFLMEIAPGGTNHPHHHEREEEIYLVLEGHGDMVAGSGLDGIAGRFAAHAGDAYFFRTNCTVGYYSAPDVKSRILAVRSWYPGMELIGMEH